MEKIKNLTRKLEEMTGLKTLHLLLIGGGVFGASLIVMIMFSSGKSDDAASRLEKTNLAWQTRELPQTMEPETYSKEESFGFIVGGGMKPKETAAESQQEASGEEEGAGQEEINANLGDSQGLAMPELKIKENPFKDQSAQKPKLEALSGIKTLQKPTGLGRGFASTKQSRSRIGDRKGAIGNLNKGFGAKGGFGSFGYKAGESASSGLGNKASLANAGIGEGGSGFSGGPTSNTPGPSGGNPNKGPDNKPNQPSDCTPQSCSGGLTDLTVNFTDIGFDIWDCGGADDGDIIQLLVNGTGNNITTSFNHVMVTNKLKDGSNEIKITAINEGEYPPNTGCVKFLPSADPGALICGNAQQSWGPLNVGQSDGMTITVKQMSSCP